MRFVTPSTSFWDLPWTGQSRFFFVPFFPELRGSEGLCKQWMHAFGAHKTSTRIWSASSQYIFFSLLRLTLYTFCSILQQQLNTRKKEIRISRLLLRRKKKILFIKGARLMCPRDFSIHLLYFTFHNLTFYNIFFAKVEEKKELLTTHEWIWMTKYGQSVSWWAYQVDTSVVHACGPTAGSIRS